MGLSENQIIAIFLNINQHDSQTNDSQWLMFYWWVYPITLWLFNIAMENHHF